MGERDTLVVIPARMDSSRFPGKPLADAGGKPLLWHTWQAVKDWPRAAAVVIATPDQAIADAMEAFGAMVRLTSPSHRNGSQRAFGVFREFPLSYLIDVQCDEPEVTHGMLGAVMDRLDDLADISTLAAEFPGGVPPEDPNEVKVVCDSRGRALYFSRHPIPASHRHIGVYGFAAYPVHGLRDGRQSPCGEAEGLEQLDWLEHYDISVTIIDHAPLSINTPADLELFREHLKAKGTDDPDRHD